MKYVLTGGAGNISKPLAEQLLKAGHHVTVIGRNPEHLKPLTDQGAKAAIGSVEDVSFLTEAFKGADAVYTMVPPIFEVDDWKSYIGQIGKNYADAIKAAGVKYVVNLSSVGAHMEDGAGPVTGLYRVEQSLNELKDVNVKHVRPGYFFYNFFGNIGMVKGMNIFGGNAAKAEDKMVLSDTTDIATAVAEELLNLNFTGHSVRYIASDERTPVEVATALGTAVGKPELPYVEFSDEDMLGGLKGAGLHEEIAKNYTEMGHAMRTGKMLEDYQNNRPQEFGKVKLEDFAKQFAVAYNAS
ncbi:MAG: NAD-dependent epimerase/dehydratase family protein [Chitinophagaceae bacterium]|nr:MAG: NAD-dependent epimerase/dehydratase family protein [Chitinophagaceae bacterium]